MLHYTPYCCWAYFVNGKYKTVILLLHYRSLIEGNFIETAYSKEMRDALKSFRKKFINEKLKFSDVSKYQKTKLKKDFKYGDGKGIYEEIGNDDHFKGDYYFDWECEPIKNERYEEILNKFGNRNEDQMEEEPIDWFFGIGSGRVYVEEGNCLSETHPYRNTYCINLYGLKSQ